MRSAYLAEYNVTVFENGDVVSAKGKKLALQTCRAGYKRIFVRRKSDGKRFGAGLHRLIALAFIPNPLNKSSVNHRDGNKANNSIENLEWCTHKENMQHAFKNGFVREGKADFHERIGIRNRAIYSLREHGWKQDDIAKAFNTTQENVSTILNA